MNNSAIEIEVIGKVQGVFFRKSALKAAADFNVNGWVKNKKNGSVVVHAEGDEDALNKMENWCQHGSAQAQVEKVIVKKVDFLDLEDFEIQYDD